MKEICKVPKCFRPCERRGLCVSHSAMMSKLVQHGNVTFLELLHADKIGTGHRTAPTPLPRSRRVRPFVKCLDERCETDARSRGLCGKHYTDLYLQVRAGLTSWEDLVFQGAVNPAIRLELNHSFRDWALEARGQ